MFVKPVKRGCLCSPFSRSQNTVLEPVAFEIVSVILKKIRVIFKDFLARVIKKLRYTYGFDKTDVIITVEINAKPSLKCPPI